MNQTAAEYFILYSAGWYLYWKLRFLLTIKWFCFFFSIEFQPFNMFEIT